MTDWGGGKIDQNTPSVCIVDAGGTLQFKDLGRSTDGRPEHDYPFKARMS